MMSTQIVHDLPTDIWDAYVHQHPQGNIFHTREMFEVWSRTKGYRPELWAALNNDQIAALMLPAHISLWKGWLQCMTTRSIIFGDILASPVYGSEGMAQLLEAYQAETRESLFTELRHRSETSVQNLVIARHGFRFAEHCNYLINLAMSPEQVWNQIGKATRKNIRKARNKDELVVEETTDRSQILEWYSLLKQTYEHAHVPLADISLFQAAFEILRPKGMVQFLLARIGSTPVAASVALLYKDVIFGWYRGFDRAYSHYIPNDLMVWHLLEWGSQNGYRVFNFGGAGDPNEEYGPRSFKAKFGGTLVSVGRSTYIHRPVLLKVSKIGYEALRRFL